jgi:hypothetical protein
MKIEYLDGSRSPLPLVRLFDFRPDEVNALRQVCNDLADGKLTEFSVHEQPWARQVNGCRFLWRAAQKDIGVPLPSPGEPFVLEYSDEAWREVEEKLLQFVEPRPNTFNWLTTEGDVEVLISMDGKW